MGPNPYLNFRFDLVSSISIRFCSYDKETTRHLALNYIEYPFSLIAIYSASKWNTILFYNKLHIFTKSYMEFFAFISLSKFISPLLRLDSVRRHPYHQGFGLGKVAHLLVWAPGLETLFKVWKIYDRVYWAPWRKKSVPISPLLRPDSVRWHPYHNTKIVIF